MPAIKRKADELAGSSDVEKIHRLQAELADGQTSLNNIVHLLDFASSSNVEVLEQSHLALYKVFKKLVSLKKLEKSAKGETPTIVTWLRERYGEYIKTLLTVGVPHKKVSIQSASIILLLRLLRDDPLNANPGQFPVDQYGRLVSAMLTCGKLHDATTSTFRQDYLEPFADLRYYFCKFVEKTATQAKQASSRAQQDVVRDNCINFLSALVSIPAKDEDLTKFWIAASNGETLTPKGPTSASNHRKAFSDAWLAVLRFSLTEEQYKHVLGIMHKRIIPYMPKPQLLMDFYTDSYNAGGTTSLLALNGLFYLMDNHGLDYPLFYGKLYALFNEHTMHVRYRSRFFRMADLFLNSRHVAASLVASFIKRMSRLSLTAPPAAIVIMIPLTYNLLKAHPSLMPMIHRPPVTTHDATIARTDGAAHSMEQDGQEEESRLSMDVFDAEEPDPARTRAQDSSLWEMSCLTSHFHPNVVTLARILGEQFTKPQYNLEDFLDHSYTTMTDAELRKKLKNQIPTAFEKPTKLWPESDVVVF